jgi:hypothetical protein
LGYCTKQEVINALAQAMTSGNPATTGTLVPITTIGNSLTSTISDEEAFQYIRWADEEVDSKISSIYRVPLTRVNQGAFPLFSDATTGDEYVILVDATRFTEGDVVLIRDGTNWQEMIVAEYTNSTTLNFTTPLANGYVAAETKIERIRYPEPIPLISARLAAAHLYDKHFMAQQEGNESNYGKALRGEAYADLNGVLSGVVRIRVPDANRYTGMRYANGALFNVLPTKAEAGKEWFKGQA